MSENLREVEGITLYEAKEDSEERRVFGLKEDCIYLIGELTKGPLTKEIFGSEIHFHQIVLKEDDFAACARSLGAHDDPDSADDLTCQLRIWFGATTYFLSDLMDRLDQCNVHYGYFSDSKGYFMAYRPDSKTPSLHERLQK
ncbi:MAG: hypothetical protein ACOX4F_00660 [Atopobiaceae bacterium]|jgi:hypothetical protein